MRDDAELSRALATRAIRSQLLRLKWLGAAMCFEIAMRRHDRALKANFNPNQPRVPRGEDGAGQWTDAEDDGLDGAELPTAYSELIRLAGDVTGFTKHGINQAISRGISPRAILEAVVNPIQIIPQSNGTSRYVGAEAVVVLNPAGRVVTVWGR
ncbi:MAG TPA: hypothetical protein VFA57_10350 [Pseudolabrys sp.]|jgi:hypothetical protein|nr:hypothetical protein [Pseudolabrys sp.]